MRPLLLPILFLLCWRTLPIGAQVKHLPLHQTSDQIVIDGAVDGAWAEADSVSDFFQLEPYYAQPPSVRTIAKVITGADALYCLMICYGDGGKVQNLAGLHDQGSGDIVSVMLDTFDDKQSAYKFAVTAAGVRIDARLLDDGRNRDYSWDAVWFADSRVYEWGYVVEIKIPYKSIRFNPDLQEWGLDFDRWAAEAKEDLYWCRYEKNEGQRISKFGRLDMLGFRPSQAGLNLEVYPVAIAKARDLTSNRVKVDPAAGIDLFFNPSEKLTFQLTGNPDFAQIEADPFEFNISRYETYFTERRPFFTEGNEIFMASGRERSSGFYRPLELLYTRRIGKVLPDGNEVPLVVGTKAFGRAGDWEYGGFYSVTAETDYMDGLEAKSEPRASFVSGRVKKSVFDNSTIGVLFAAKSTREGGNGVVDIDGALRTSDWQLAYQIARSFNGSQGDFAGSACFKSNGKDFIAATRVRAVGTDFDINQVGFVPWRGTLDLVGLAGPVWYYDAGWLRQLMLYTGGGLGYEHADLYTDVIGLLGLNMQFRDNWGYELNISGGKSKDQGVTYTSYEISWGSWYNISTAWDGNLSLGYSKTYNFSRDYLASYGYGAAGIGWRASNILSLGTSLSAFLEWNPAGMIEDVTYNARPYFSLTPWNDVNLRVYADNLFLKSSDRLEQLIIGVLFSYNFLPKSWVYIAFNEGRNREDQFDGTGNVLPKTLHVAERAAVVKVKYLYYF